MKKLLPSKSLPGFGSHLILRLHERFPLLLPPVCGLCKVAQGLELEGPWPLNCGEECSATPTACLCQFSAQVLVLSEQSSHLKLPSLISVKLG